MINITYYNSIIGKIVLMEKHNKLIGLKFENQKYFFNNLKDDLVEYETLILKETKQWLSRYFDGEKPSLKELELTFCGSDFQKIVWNLLLEIPYGKVITYKAIAMKVAKIKNVDKMSAQAVGSAIGHNPISIIIPCHRVIGSNGKLIGYAGGLDKKYFLLKHEGVFLNTIK